MTTRPRNFPLFGGVKAKPRLEFARASPGNNAPRRVSITFYANMTWTAPAGVRVIQRMTGKGSDGQPASGSQDIENGYTTYQTLHYKQNGGPEQVGNTQNMGFSAGSPVPSDYCSSHAFDGPDLEYWYCYHFAYAYVDHGDYVYATTGAASTGFGQVFAGGPSAQPAPVSTFLNVQIVTGTGYSIVVPLGGYITIEY